MMKRKTLFLLLLFICKISFTQPTQAELEAMQKKLRHQMDSVLNRPEIKKYIDNPNTGIIPNKPPDQVSVAPYSSTDFEKIQLPKKDSIRIKSISGKNYSLSELHSYLGNLYSQLAKKLRPDAVASANAIAAKLNNEPPKLEAAAILAWQKGAIEESVLLATKGASLSEGDGLLLTNAGAILDMSGLSEKAIPVLRTVVSYDPQNAIAFNNLGQAFTALGMQDSALYYLSRCLSLSPQHPEANNTAGVIELKRGNKTKAQAYFENSIRGGFNYSAYSGLRYLLKEKCRIAHLIKPKVKLPEYFNQFRYKLPPQCLNVQQAATVQAEQKAFKQVISNSIRAYQKLGKEAEKKMAARSAAEFNQSIYDKINKGQNYLKPFQIMGGIMEAETILEYRDDRNDLQKFNTENRRQYKELEQQYKNEYAALLKKYEDEDKEECCGEGDVSCCPNAEAFCRDANTLKNRFLSQFAQLNEEWQSRNLQVEIKHFDNLIYWAYFSAIDTTDYKVRFFQRVVNYLTVLQQLAEVKILEPCIAGEPDEIEDQQQKELKEFDCPAELEIPFLVGKFQLDCEKVAFAAGEGIVFKYEKKFAGLRQSTMSLGIGAELYKFKVKGMGVEGGAEAKIGASVFLTFDKMNNLTDGGMQIGAKAAAGIEFETGEKIKLKKDLVKTEIGAGWRLGYSSGLSLDEGPLKNALDKALGPSPEIQRNKNVKIYN